MSLDHLLSYELADFFLFTSETYFRLIELHNRDWWFIGLLLGVAALTSGFIGFRRPELASRCLLVVLGAAWLFIAISFFADRYAGVFAAAPWIAWLFAAQGVIQIRRALGPIDEPQWPGPTSVALLALALFAHPLISIALGQDIQSLDVALLGPDGTVLFTLAMLLIIRGRHALPDLLLPLVYCVLSVVSYIGLEAPLYTLTPTLAAALTITGLRIARPPKNQA